MEILARVLVPIEPQASRFRLTCPGMFKLLYLWLAGFRHVTVQYLTIVVPENSIFVLFIWFVDCLCIYIFK